MENYLHHVCLSLFPLASLDARIRCSVAAFRMDGWFQLSLVLGLGEGGGSWFFGMGGRVGGVGKGGYDHVLLTMPETPICTVMLLL